MTVFADCCSQTEVDPNKRVRWMPGMIVGDDEMRQDQRYLMARDDRHQRALHGWGVVAGLTLAFGNDDHVEFGPGTAIDAAGRSICVPTTQCADLVAWLGQQKDVEVVEGVVPVWVTLCYDECLTDLLPVASGPCGSWEDSVQPSRLRDSFRLELSLTEPVVCGELAELEPEGLFDTLLVEGMTPEEKQEVLAAFVAERAGAGYASPCLDGLDPGCVPLGVATVVALTDDDGEVTSYVIDTTGAVDDDHNPAHGPLHGPASRIDTTVRPVVLSTQFLQEWLKALPVGGAAVPTDPPPVPALNDLIDVTAPANDTGFVVVGTGDTGADPKKHWEARLLDLDDLGDVDLSMPPVANQVLKFDGTKWVAAADATGGGGQPPAGDLRPHVLRRTAELGIVAAGVAELKFEVKSNLDEDGGFLFQFAGFRRTYGGLDVVGELRSLDALRLDLVFHEYARAAADADFLARAGFVVKLTPESSYRPMSAMVLKMGEESFSIGLLADPRPPSGWLEVASDPSGENFAVHIEVSAFVGSATSNGLLEEFKLVDRT